MSVGYVFHCSRCRFPHAGECDSKQVVSGPKLSKADSSTTIDYDQFLPTAVLPATLNNSVPWPVGAIVAARTPGHDGIVFRVTTDIDSAGYQKCEIIAADGKNNWGTSRLGSIVNIGRDSYWGQHSKQVSP